MPPMREERMKAPVGSGYLPRSGCPDPAPEGRDVCANVPTAGLEPATSGFSDQRSAI